MDLKHLLRRRASTVAPSSRGLAKAPTVPLFPSAADLRPGRSEVAVAAAVAEGPYGDAGALLAVQRDLLAEDFLRALAAQLDDVRANPKLLQSSAYYFVKGSRVQLEKKRPGQTRREPVGVLMQFNAERYRHVKWEDEKRFMVGNMVLLSADAAFAAPSVGIVVEADPHQLRRGQVVVKMVAGLDAHCNYITRQPCTFVNKQFHLVESSAFYFPYLHVTTALNGDLLLLRQNAVARLADELVHCKFPSSARPAYLSVCDSWTAQRMRAHCELQGLNASQVEAFESAMAHRVALVQGPPGTGKTFLGTKIAECLVKIKTEYPGALPGPILVITTTNHAVHEFLRKCSGFSDKIIHAYSEKHSKEDYGPLQREYDACKYNSQRAELMKEADIMAMTTTRAAYMRTTLDLQRIKIVIVEEAAEALEGFVLAGLPRHTEHLIQIGDHKQLQPSCSHQPLAESHRLNLSLFERLILNGAECVMLNEQRRMRPAISRLVRSIYPTLTDHTTTHGRDAVKGVDLKTPVAFLSRDDRETPEGKGFVNLWEAEMAARLGKYLLLRGASADEITILTTYRRQLNLIKQKLRALGETRKIKATTVDNFQGEENRIIILSLVRSNASGHIGFLKMENRACVALSRARDAFFMLGNLDCLVASRAPIWSHVHNTLAPKGRVRTGLPLVCEHGKKFLLCATAEEVAVAERGCVVCQVRAALLQSEQRVKDCETKLAAVEEDIKTINEELVKVLLDVTSSDSDACIDSSDSPTTDSEEEDKVRELTEKREARVKERERLGAQLPILLRAKDESQVKWEGVKALLEEKLLDPCTDTMVTVERKLNKQKRRNSSRHPASGDGAEELATLLEGISLDPTEDAD